MSVLKIIVAILVLSNLCESKSMRFLVGAGGLNNVLGIVGKIAEMWSDICGAFGTRTSSVIKTTLIKQGFDYFAGNSTLHISKKVRPENYTNYSARLIRRSGVPLESRDFLLTTLEEAEFSEASIWGDFDIIFNNENTDNDKVRYFNMHVNRRDCRWRNL